MVIIYSTFHSARLAYILDEIFVHRLGKPYILTQDTHEYLSSEFTKVNYSDESLPGLYIKPFGLLNETGIRSDLNPQIANMDGNTFLFLQESEFGFDVFCHCFWYLSRYEEYGHKGVDPHGRFLFSESRLNKSVNPLQPWVDIAIHLLAEKLNLPVPARYGIFPTLDIDQAWKYKYKPLWVFLGGFFRDLIHFNFSGIRERLTVAIGGHDPWYIYEELPHLTGTSTQNTLLFLQIGPRGRYDKNIHPENKKFQNLILKLSSLYETGLHPSYQSDLKIDKILKEKSKLESLTGKPVTRSRQHFLKGNIPELWDCLESCEIQHDYTMGFPDHIGFRAGTAQSFRAFNLHRNVKLALVIHPFCAMDVSLRNYMQCDVKTAQQYLAELHRSCKEYQIPFCFIFHNESLSDSGEWRGWKYVFLSCLN